MSSHVYHPDELAHLVLHDGCPRCEEHAQAPWFSLDRENLDKLVDIAIAWEDGGEGRWPGSDAEQLACQRILDVLNATRAMFGASSRTAVVNWMRSATVRVMS